jgi:hypothetical protein
VGDDDRLLLGTEGVKNAIDDCLNPRRDLRSGFTGLAEANIQSGDDLIQVISVVLQDVFSGQTFPSTQIDLHQIVVDVMIAKSRRSDPGTLQRR